jgi:hypothetical protein
MPWAHYQFLRGRGPQIGMGLLAGGGQKIAHAGEPLLKIVGGGQGLRVAQASTGEQPGWVVAAGAPSGGGTVQVVGSFEVVALLGQPAGELVPLAQQAFQRDLDHGLPVAGVFDQQPLVHHLLDEGVAGGGQVIPPREAAHRLVVVGVDGG